MLKSRLGRRLEAWAISFDQRRLGRCRRTLAHPERNEQPSLRRRRLRGRRSDL